MNGLERQEFQPIHDPRAVIAGREMRIVQGADGQLVAAVDRRGHVSMSLQVSLQTAGASMIPTTQLQRYDDTHIDKTLAPTRSLALEALNFVC